jgi:hypothetical protein
MRGVKACDPLGCKKASILSHKIDVPASSEFDRRWFVLKPQIILPVSQLEDSDSSDL